MTDLEELDEHAKRARSAREALVGKTIAGRYVLRGLVGHGGMGAVYEAEHLGLGKRVAIKFVDPEFATDEKVVKRFAREARAMSAMESAHIVTVFDAGTEDGRPYLVMELLRGEDLGQRLRRTRRVALSEAMHIVAQVLKGLARAHSAGIVHRDLKPDNVFLVKHDTDPLFAKIVDFGISKIERPRANTSPLALTGRGTVLGTPFYMSPEQAQASSEVDGRADLYSVGAILFECLTGRPPHTGESYEQVILKICMRDAPEVRSIEPSIPADVSAFVARALTRDRTQRYPSAERMLAALHEVAPEERTRVPLDSPPATLLAAPAMDATVLDGGSPRSSRPSDEISAVTRLGVGPLATTSATETARSPGVDGSAAVDAVSPEHMVTRPEGLRRAAQEAVAKADADADAKGKAKADAKAKAKAAADAKGARVSAPSPPKPIGAALITAAVATLLGIGVTFGVISILDKRAASEGPANSASAGSSAAPRSAETPTSTGSAGGASPDGGATTPNPQASASSAARSGSSSDAGSGKLGGPSPPRSGSVVAPPRPSSTKPLDIQRDLP